LICLTFLEYYSQGSVENRFLVGERNSAKSRSNKMVSRILPKIQEKEKDVLNKGSESKNG
jgi:hypothetical protein